MALKIDGDRVNFSTTLKKENRDKIKELTKKTGLPTSKIIDMCIEDFIKKVETDGLTVRLEL